MQNPVFANRQSLYIFIAAVLLPVTYIGYVLLGGDMLPTDLFDTVERWGSAVANTTVKLLPGD